MSMEKLHENVRESDLVELFGLGTTNYLIDKCSTSKCLICTKMEHTIAMHLF